MERLIIKRWIATAIDACLVIVPIYIVCTIISLFWKPIWAYYTILLIIGMVKLEVFFYLQKKDTLGKQHQRIEIQTEENKQVPLQWYILRSVIKAVSLFAFNGLLMAASALWMLMDESESIHDKLARTKVWIK